MPDEFYIGDEIIKKHPLVRPLITLLLAFVTVLFTIALFVVTALALVLIPVLGALFTACWLGLSAVLAVVAPFKTVARWFKKEATDG